MRLFVSSSVKWWDRRIAEVKASGPYTLPALRLISFCVKRKIFVNEARQLPKFNPTYCEW